MSFNKPKLNGTSGGIILWKPPTYRSYIVAMIIDTESTMKMCYKLKMLGVPIDGTSQILGDIEIMVISCHITSSTLNNKHNHTAYHWFREAVDELFQIQMGQFT